MAYLSDEHINWIRTNIRNRGITSIDLEFEMTDHIASATEEIMAQGTPFREAFRKVMLSFGPFDMERLQKEKSKFLANRGYKLFGKAVVAYFGWPKAVLTALIFSACYLFFERLSVTHEAFEIGIICCGVLGLGLGGYMLYKGLHAKYAELGQIYLMYYFILFLPVNYIVPLTERFQSMQSVLAYSTIITILIVFQLAYFSVWKKVREEIESRYRHRVA